MKPNDQFSTARAFLQTLDVMFANRPFQYFLKASLYLGSDVRQGQATSASRLRNPLSQILGNRIRGGIDDPGPNTDTVDIDSCRLGMLEEVYSLPLGQEDNNSCVVPCDPGCVEQMCRIHVAVAHLPKNLIHRGIRGKILDLDCPVHITFFRWRNVADSGLVLIEQLAVLFFPVDAAVPDFMDQLVLRGVRIAVGGMDSWWYRLTNCQQDPIVSSKLAYLPRYIQVLRMTDGVQLTEQGHGRCDVGSLRGIAFIVLMGKVGNRTQ